MTEEAMAFGSAREWEEWLAANHETSDGVWLLIAKKDGGATSVSYPEAVEAALCFGWIDGQKGPLDDVHWRQRFTPRRARSKWSQINRDKAQALIADGRMRPAGQREVERAKADGRWDAAYAGAKAATVPPDLEQALAENDEARAFFATLSGAKRYAILYRIQDAKRPQTRADRIAKFVAMLGNHETLLTLRRQGDAGAPPAWAPRRVDDPPGRPPPLLLPSGAKATLARHRLGRHGGSTTLRAGHRRFFCPPAPRPRWRATGLDATAGRRPSGPATPRQLASRA